jgi:hypothetical protein
MLNWRKTTTSMTPKKYFCKHQYITSYKVAMKPKTHFKGRRIYDINKPTYVQMYKCNELDAAKRTDFFLIFPAFA